MHKQIQFSLWLYDQYADSSTTNIDSRSARGPKRLRQNTVDGVYHAYIDETHNKAFLKRSSVAQQSLFNLYE